jgi:TonB family protein
MALGAWLAAAPPAAAQQNAADAPPPAAVTDPSRLDQQPRLLNTGEVTRQITERYPPALLAGRVSGAVFLRFRILEDGRVDSASVSAVQATDPAFVEPATAVGRRLVFSAPAVGGRPVSLWYEFDIRFLPTSSTRASSGDRQPLLRNGGEVDQHVAALYPPALRDARVAGRVLLRLRIEADGRVDSASVAPLQATDPAFVEPAKAAARRMVFTPASAEGLPVAYWHSWSLRFQPPAQAHGEEGVSRTAPPDEGTYELSAIEEQPRLQNAAEVARLITTAYPAALADSGIAGHVMLRFRILENGQADPATISAVQSTHPGFAEPAISVARGMRFRPARTGGRPVKVWVDLPIFFRLAGPRPARPDSSGTGTPGQAPGGARP